MNTAQFKKHTQHLITLSYIDTKSCDKKILNEISDIVNSGKLKPPKNLPDNVYRVYMYYFYFIKNTTK
jgi:hypothetical protein